MIDINLLNNKKLNDSQSDFFDIDQSLVEKSDQFESKPNKINIKKKKKSKAANNKSKNSFLILFAVCVFLIVGGCFYYQFYFQYKSEISSQNIERTLHYLLDHDNIDLVEFDFRNEGIKLNLEIKNNSFDNVKGEIRKHLNRIDNFRDFTIERSGDYLLISYPYFVDIINIEYDENRITEDYKVSNIDDLNKKSLKEVLNKIFKTNNSNLINFRVILNQSHKNHFYNLFFH